MWDFFVCLACEALRIPPGSLTSVSSMWSLRKRVLCASSVEASIPSSKCIPASLGDGDCHVIWLYREIGWPCDIVSRVANNPSHMVVGLSAAQLMELLYMSRIVCAPEDDGSW